MRYINKISIEYFRKIFSDENLAHKAELGSRLHELQHLAFLLISHMVLFFTIHVPKDLGPFSIYFIQPLRSLSVQQF